MVKVNDITLSISEVSNKGIIILVPRKEKRIRFKKGSVMINMFGNGIGAMYLPKETLIAKSEKMFLGKPILSLKDINDCNIYFIPTNLKKYRVYFTEIDKVDNMHKYLCKKLMRHYQ